MKRAIKATPKKKAMSKKKKLRKGGRQKLDRMASVGKKVGKNVGVGAGTTKKKRESKEFSTHITESQGLKKSWEESEK